MIQADAQKLAARYATAALNIWPLSESDISDIYLKFHEAIACLTDNPSLSFFLTVPLIDNALKLEVLAQVQRAYGLPPWLDKLHRLLIEHKRLYLVPFIYKELIHQAQLRNNIIPCVVRSPQLLTGHQKNICTCFTQKLLHGVPLITWVIDPALIAGIRIQTQQYQWEHSIDSRLRSLTDAILM